MPENKDFLESGAYKEAMDKLNFSSDFESKLLGKVMEQQQQPVRRFPLKKVVAFGAMAAVLAVGFIGLRQLRNPLALQPATDELAPQINQVEMMTTEASDDADTAAYEEEAPATEASEPNVAMMMDMADGAPVPGAAYESLGLIQPGEVLFRAAPQVEMNTAEFSSITENKFESTASNPLSTFAADVDTASYSIVRAALQSGNSVAPDMVRTEEFINYFNYDYPKPNAGEPLSVTTEIADCPWNPDSKLMLVGLQAEKVDAKELPPQNLVFLIDVSGSMDYYDKLPLAQKAFKLLTEQLRPNDRVSIVTYAGSDDVVLKGASGEDRAKIMDAIDNLFAGGSTDGASGILTAYELAREYFIDGGNNRVILATDGDLNVGTTSEGELVKLIEKERESGVYLSVMGFGDDNLKDNKLEALADNGNGNYGYIDTELEARKLLVEEMGATFFTVAKDVKLQVEFNPKVVSEYRLIGYENRALADSDFANDTVDGGEIGAGHSVTALYEIKLGQAASDLKYSTQPDYVSHASTDFATVSVRAKAPDGDVSKLYEYPVDASKFVDAPSANLRFAAAVAEVCMNLRDSEFKGSATYESATKLLDGIENLNSDPYKDEFAYLVRQLSRGRIN